MDTGSHLTPFKRLVCLLREERQDLSILLIYTVMAGLLTLAIPLAAQALVNTVAAGVLVQPLVVLSVMVFVGLLFAGLMCLAQFYLVEILQQRFFAKVSLRLAGLFPRIKHIALLKDYPPELVNRFFDVVKVQKTLSKLLMEGPAASLQIIVGLILMAFYSPYLLGFDLFIIVSIFFIAFVLGINGLKTSIAESHEKYRIGAWLEDIARCQASLKIHGQTEYLLKRADDMVVHYLQYRRAHFKVLFRQAAAHYLFQAIASAGILSIGGWLVINRELTLGQLVAAELVMLIVLSALEKLVMLFQDYYDLLTALEKIGHITDLPVEVSNGHSLPDNPRGCGVSCRDVYFEYEPNAPLLRGLSMDILPGERVCLVGMSGMGKSTLAALLCSLHQPTRGTVIVNDTDLRVANLSSLRSQVALVNSNREIFEGTVEDNIHAGRDFISAEAIQWALRLTRLDDDITRFPNGIHTQLVSTGRNISRGQITRLMIARAIVSRPRLLILDDAFPGVDERTRLDILEALLHPGNPWTVIAISNDLEVIYRSQRVLVLSNGVISESGRPEDVINNRNSVIYNLFPQDKFQRSRL